jgi:F-type H+-transporting ATPase subunit epsilon
MAAPKGRVPPGKLRLEVVTPTGMVLSELVDEFTATSVKGEFGVLPGHIPMLSALRIGLLSYRKGSETESCAIGTGFVEVVDDVALVLTDRFLTKDKIDVVQTRLRLKEIDEQLEKWSEEPGSPKHQAVIEEEQWQAAVLTLYGDPPPPTIKTYEQYSSDNKEEQGQDAGKTY